MTASGATPPKFDQLFRHDFEQLLVWRRDVRHFRRDPVDGALIERLIAMACLSPSVGNSQPWRFVRITDLDRRAAVRANFAECNAEALQCYHGERARLYADLKLAGLDDAPEHLAVFCDHGSDTGHGLGSRTMPETKNFSVVAAVYTLWLAARIFGLGVGWVSILDPERVRASLDVPEEWSLIAYLCIGKPVEESDEPELVRLGWQEREAFEKVLFRR
ncbi:5,6-dimethylbenzimidazole synthase [Telmatospirillum sp.]|uniref:5,6-dimethylbenzimidazole synthase n=1 Tax=Telmatospirillum sp. TaxID=2079197 RepID=UPI002844D2A2|nr:5,6-dimethylbenzimidazole synthase [Telmatospirillum sp.]MDR3439504.1 5,6-dimethylbenzimidazole synthase [Telmatospirillum sp.]